MSLVSPWIPTDVQLNSILIATDFSPASEKPLQHAIALARHYGAKLYLLHVVDSLGFTLAGPDATEAARILAFRDAGRLERELVLSGALEGLRHQVIIREGNIRDELEKVVRQEHIDLVVVGTHSRTGISRLVLGSVAERIFRCTSCLVVTVGPHSPTESPIKSTETLRPVLFATDFSEPSLRALPYVVSFANQLRTGLALLHALPPVPHPEGDRRHTASDAEQMKRELRRNTRQRLQELTAHYDLAVEPVLMAEFGEPAEEILQAAGLLHAGVIILGLKRDPQRDVFARLHWSTAYRVVCGAACPVLTIRD